MDKRLILAMVAVGVVCAGCTTSSPGEATPAPGGNSSSTSTVPSSDPGAPSSTVEVPPRPRDISLDGLDPCTLFTEAQRTQLKVGDVDSGESESDNFKGMKECSLEVKREPFYDYTALAVTTEGLEAWLTGNRNVDAELTSVQGFPAAQFKFRGSDGEGCDLAVGVADGQYLWIEVVPYDRVFEQDELCQMVGQATDLAMTTLQTLK